MIIQLVSLLFPLMLTQTAGAEDSLGSFKDFGVFTNKTEVTSRGPAQFADFGSAINIAAQPSEPNRNYIVEKPALTKEREDLLADLESRN